MENSNQDQDHKEGHIERAKLERITHNPNPERDNTGNWDEKAHLSRNIQKNNIQNERRNLNPDQEKRTGSTLKTKQGSNK